MAKKPAGASPHRMPARTQPERLDTSPAARYPSGMQADHIASPLPGKGEANLLPMPMTRRLEWLLRVTGN